MVLGCIMADIARRLRRRVDIARRLRRPADIAITELPR
jgi:hypothetical protein